MRYDRLTNFLERQLPGKISLSFAEIEKTLDSKLPPSAFKHRAWWSNDASPGRQSCGWMSAGWRTVDVDVVGARVGFRKEGLEEAIKIGSITSEGQNFWWVNHKQSHKYEIKNGLLWSPQKYANGRKSFFYDNMRRAKPGDFVLSMANGKIGAIGIVEDYAGPAPIPVSYNNENNLWSKIGWMLPVAWAQISDPIKVKDYINQIRQHLPEKYSPIQSKTGNGNQGAYLTSVSKVLFLKVLELSGEALESLYIHNAASSFDQFDDQLENHDTSMENLSDTEKMQVSKSRRGQGIFKKNVRNRLSACPITQVDDIRFLIASHIKPWRVCETAHDRLSGNNGLLLARHVDHLFDKGYISFSDDGTVLRSKSLEQNIVHYLGLSSQLTSAKLEMNTDQKIYMEYHRDYIFRKGD
ncbi:MAG: HNH endonuclease signature motif containing protein [Litorimonas sp.]